MRRALEAKKTGTLKDILWHQGESDHGNPEGYAEKLQQLVKDLRQDLEIEELPFVAGQIILKRGVRGQKPEASYDDQRVSDFKDSPKWRPLQSA